MHIYPSAVLVIPMKPVKACMHEKAGKRRGRHIAMEQVSRKPQHPLWTLFSLIIRSMWCILGLPTKSKSQKKDDNENYCY